MALSMQKYYPASDLERYTIAAGMSLIGVLSTMGIALFLILIYALLILLPPVLMWRSLSRRASRRLVWFRPVLALFGPFLAAFAFSVLVWLPAYSGRCGGWLGETSPCGFAQYAMETVFWAAMGLAMPAVLGMLLGFVVLIVGWFRRGPSRG